MPEGRRKSVNIRSGDVQTGRRNVVPAGMDVVASYNWSSKSRRSHPHIIVPGAPRKFVMRRDRFQLIKDGDSFADENRSRMEPFSAMEPLFHSLGICSPEFDLRKVDIVTDRNNLRNLLKFCRSPGDTTSTPEFGKQDFKFFVHAIGDAERKGGQTLVFTRAAVAYHNIKGYGHNFEEVLTQMEPGNLPDAGSFRVVVKMNLDGMTLLVRSEVDACERAGRRASTPVSSPKPSPAAAAAAAAADDNAETSAERGEDLLAKTLEGIRLSSSSGGGESKSAVGVMRIRKSRSGLTSTMSGELLDGDAQVLELKTKNSRFADEINWKDIYWQLALGGAHKLVLGLHNRGNFGVGDVELCPINEVKDRAGEPSMVFLVNTLRDIIKAAHSIFATAGSSADGQPSETPAPSSGSEGPGRASTTFPPVAANATAVVVEYSPLDDSICVRPANASDGAVAPF